MKMSKKVLSVLLAVLLLAMTVAVAAVPANAVSSSGWCGDNVWYRFDSSTGDLTIGGSGTMTNYLPGAVNRPFYGNSIKSVTIESGVISIGSYEFCDCTNLSKVTLPNSGLIVIQGSAFRHCYSLEKVVIPAECTSVGQRAFDYCNNLSAVLIASKNVSFSENAFDSCSNLRDVYFVGSEEEWNNGIHIASGNTYLENATMHFNYNAGSDPKIVKIKLSTDGGGTVSGGGIYMTGESVTIKATPNSGYVFDGWYYRNNKISTNATYTFAAAADGALTADFRKARTCTVSVSASPSAGGTVTGGGTYTEGQTATVKATLNFPYTFEGWYNGSTLVSTKATYSFTVTGSVSLTAKYKKPTTFTITVVAEPAEGGTVTGGGFVNGTGSIIVATPNEGWHFVGWFKDGSKVSDNASYAVSVADDKKTFTAKFERDTTPDNPGQPDNPGDPGTTPAQPESVCPWCGGQHVGFFQGIIGFFHGIFAKLFGARY